MKANMIVGGLFTTLVLAGVLTALNHGGAATTAKPDLEKREQNLRESIERMTSQREELRAEVIALKQQLAELRRATNEVIVIKIILPPNARAADIKAERE